MIPRWPITRGLSASRIIKGGWHLAGGHGVIDRQAAKRDMALFIDAGITSFDCADIYTGVEELIGEFRAEYPQHARALAVHTKFVPDLDLLGTIDGRGVEAIIDRSRARLRMDQLDLVQFHWWDYAVPRYVETALELLRLKHAGKIGAIAVTNFDVPHLAELVAAGVPVVAHQLQYSLLDDRPGHGMVEFCARHGIALLCYGTVAGGFLSERWRGHGAPAGALANRSLVKYRLIIDEFGGWPLYQELLEVLSGIAARHGCDLATVATAAVLAQPGVAAAIVGATSATHLAEHTRAATLLLSAGDQAAIAAVTGRRQGPPGDVYELERDREGPHGRIMKYNLGR